MRRSRFAPVVTLLAAVLGASTSAHALRPDELLLIVNRNVPEGKTLAEHYAKLRGVPDGRIVELPLPVGDEIPFDQYERDVVPPLRRFLTDHHLAGAVKCLVPFYGVPLRIARRPTGAIDTNELAKLQAEISRTRGEVEPIVIGFEDLAKKLDPSFTTRFTGGGLEDAAQRADRAAAAIQKALPKLTDPAARDDAYKAMLKVMEQLVGPNTVTVLLAQRALSAPVVLQADRDKWEKMLAVVRAARQRLHDLAAARYDPAARAKARDEARQGFGLLEYATIVQGQLVYLRPGDTAAALDSELALLWWDLYPRAAWQINPLKYDAPRVPHPPALMVSRVDGPDVPTVTRMLADTLRTEHDGLSGRVVVDARGIAGGHDGYAQFDRHLMNFADLVKAKSRLSLFLDVKGDVLPPNSADNVALYVGWYSVGKYVPGSKLVPGAVGYHVASYELTTLHHPTNEWVAHLLTDGASASLGPVAEPYLLAFPLPEEFFPLLMTGKLTLAEAYWRTAPTASWMMSLVGDPLYNPFAKSPAMKVEDLPPALRAAATESSPPPTPPTTQP